MISGLRRAGRVVPANLTGSYADLPAWLTECAVAQYRCMVVFHLHDLLLLQEPGAASPARRWMKSPEIPVAFLTA